MNLQDAVIKRIEELREKNGMTKYRLSMESGLSQSTLCSINKKRCKSIKLSTLYWICEGFDIPLVEFFKSPIFDKINLME